MLVTMTKNPAKASKKSRYYQGKYTPKNPKKYIGDVNNIIYRSSWEKKVCYKLDHADYVIGWACEPMHIFYTKPSTGLKHRYFPDFISITLNKNKEKIVTVIEVKPDKEQFPPSKKGKKKSRYLKEALDYEVNQSKWNAAKKYCDSKGWNFFVMTEKHIFAK